jgi:hypothetical protein
MQCITRSLVILLMGLSLVGPALAHHKPDHTGGPPDGRGQETSPASVPEINMGAAAGVLALLLGGGALLRERMRSK